MQIYPTTHLVATVPYKGFESKVASILRSREICESIMQIYGMGPKIASCVALFACGKMDVFPIDTWTKQIIANEYADQTRSICIQTQRVLCNSLQEGVRYE